MKTVKENFNTYSIDDSNSYGVVAAVVRVDAVHLVQ